MIPILPTPLKLCKLKKMANNPIDINKIIGVCLGTVLSDSGLGNQLLLNLAHENAELTKQNLKLIKENKKLKEKLRRK